MTVVPTARAGASRERAGPFSFRRGRGGAMYYTDMPHSGPVIHGMGPDRIGVSLFEHGHPPIGEARCVGWTDRRFALWELTIHGEVLPGRWIILDHRFIKVR